MACQCCSFGLLQQVHWTNATITCEKCAGEFILDWDGVHLGKQEESHIMAIDKGVACPHCGFVITYLFFPCGGEWYISLENSKIGNKEN